MCIKEDQRNNSYYGKKVRNSISRFISRTLRLMVRIIKENSKRFYIFALNIEIENDLLNQCSF